MTSVRIRSLTRGFLCLVILPLLIWGCTTTEGVRVPRRTISTSSAHSSGPAVGRAGAGSGAVGDWISAETRGVWAISDIADESGSTGVVPLEPQEPLPEGPGDWGAVSIEEAQTPLERVSVPDGDYARTRPFAVGGANLSSELQTIYFDFDQSVIRGDQATRLEGNARWLLDHSDANVVLEGHCDERGTSEYNLGLSDRRAESVRLGLMELGVSGDRITTVGYGEELPADARHAEDAYSKNRRVEFKVVEP